MQDFTSEITTALSVPSEVIVLDHRGHFLEWVAPAVARFALKRAHATILLKSPFTILLAQGLDSCPRPERGRRVSAPEVVRVERSPSVNGKGNNVNKQVSKKYNPAQVMMSAIEFFDKVDRKEGGDGIVWAKATAPRGAQVIVEVRTANDKRIKIPAIRAGDPVCLSKYAPFDLLRQAEDLLQCSVAGLLRLMTNDEANAYFDRKAGILKKDPEDLMRKAHLETQRALLAQPLKEAEVDTSNRISDKYVAIDDVINPRLHDICRSISPLLPEEQRKSTQEVQEILLELEDSMTLEDAEYLDANSGTRPAIKRWAQQKKAEIHALMAGLMDSGDEGEDADGLEPDGLTTEAAVEAEVVSKATTPSNLK